MQKQKTSKREWVKTFAIIFLVILLILTFFSQTIMNRSLPEVAVQSTTSGTINAKIRGTGTVSADETYDVTINQTRKIRSIMVKVGDEVATGDPLFMLEPTDSDELKAAQDTLDEMELSYQKSLIEASNSASTENRDVQKLQEAYNEALATYNLYSTADPSQIALALEKAKVTLTDLQRASEDAQEELTEATSGTAYAEAQKNVTDLQTEIANLQAQITDAESRLDPTLPSTSSSMSNYINSLNRDKSSFESSLRSAENQYQSDLAKTVTVGSTPKTYEELRKEYISFAHGYLDLCASNTEFLKDFMRQTLEDEKLVTDEYAKALQDAYVLLANDEEEKALYEQKIADIDAQITTAQNQSNLLSTLDQLEDDLYFADRDLANAEDVVASWNSKIERLTAASKDAQRAVEDQQAVVDKYTQASSAAATLKAAEEALEDKVFSVNLGDTNSLDLIAAKEAIEEQQKVVEELIANADGQEVTADVSGIISAINVNAGNTAGADTPLATITVADRGYTVNISVTNDQARQVTIGDTATISNYYSGNMTATLENIINDPQNMGQGKILVFRLTGNDVQAGANITLSIGQKSANYDAIIPNSAIRSDANGSFVLVVVAKSSPLGNRYVATRADVTVLAADDTSSAVSGLAYGDFVITTSSKPLEAGDQVRLVDN